MVINYLNKSEISPQGYLHIWLSPLFNHNFDVDILISCFDAHMMYEWYGALEDHLQIILQAQILS